MNFNLEKPIIFFDLESTGTDVKKDRIIELYALKMHPDGREEEYYKLYDPQITIEEEASNVHGYTNEDLEKYKTFGNFASEIYHFFKDCDIGGYNCIKFDIPFLMEELFRHGYKFNPIRANIIDPYKIIGKYESNKLEDVYFRYFGEKFENAHTARADIDATIRVFKEQLKKYKLEDKSFKELSDIVRSDAKGNKFLDFNGVFYKNHVDEKYYFGIGKHRNCHVKDHPSYLNWIINKSDMNTNVKIIAEKLSNYYKKQAEMEKDINDTATENNGK